MPCGIDAHMDIDRTTKGTRQAQPRLSKLRVLKLPHRLPDVGSQVVPLPLMWRTWCHVPSMQELPGVNSHGRTLDEARETLQRLAAVVFDEERREAEELIAGKDVVRESFFVPIPRAA